MHTTTQPAYPTRLRLLLAEARQFRRNVDLRATGATIHELRNRAGAAQCALRLAQDRLTAGRLEDLAVLLDVADASLRAGRGMLARR
jgi:hypothetical protein